MERARVGRSEVVADHDAGAQSKDAIRIGGERGDFAKIMTICSSKVVVINVMEPF